MWTVILITALVICVVAIFLLVDYQKDDENQGLFEEDRQDLEEMIFLEKNLILDELEEATQEVEVDEEDTEEVVFADEGTELEDEEDATTGK